MRICLLLLLTCWLAAAEGRSGSVQFSDGSTWEGVIAMASGARLALHDGTRMRELDPATVRELRFFSEHETMERAFAMPEPGKPIRVETGEPYALRQLRAQVQLTTGEVIAGHLYATAMSVTVHAADGADPERRKLVLPAKQRGQPGQGFERLVFVQRIVFAAGAADTLPAATLAVTIAGGADELGAVAREGLVPLGVKASASAFIVDSPLGSPVLWAARRGEHIAASWPGDDAALRERITALLPELNDFFEERKAIAAWQPAGTPDAYALMRLIRRGATTDGPKHPWHLEVWRWRLDADGRGLVAARAALLRGLIAPGATMPAVHVQPGWDGTSARDGTILLEGWAP
jgi:hypothetical protein